jgi:hypothetical protein
MDSGASTSLVKIVAANLGKIGLSLGIEEYLLRHLDATLEPPLNPKLIRHRNGVLEHLCKEVGSIEYVINVLIAIPAHTDRINWLLYTLLRKSSEKSGNRDVEAAGGWLLIDSDEAKRKFWLSWWKQHQKSRVYRGLRWREYSPRLIGMLGALRPNPPSDEAFSDDATGSLS